MCSNEHISYLKKIRFNKILIKLIQISIFIIFLIVWQLLADFKVINTFVSSSPKEVFKTIIELHKTNNLYNHIFITLYETVLSFLIGTLIGIFLATILWWNKFIAKVVDPYLTILNSLPKVALGPIIIIWVGAKMNSIILMALFISTIITIMNVYQGFIETDINKIKLMKSFNAKPYQMFFKLVLPSSFPNIISALKINLSMSLVGLLPPVGEKIFFNKCYSRY
ncbi:MAG: ABC transporter permease [Bacilli bacterium]|nr:ABC transporter permease [Bacilli bacterium]